MSAGTDFTAGKSVRSPRGLLRSLGEARVMLNYLPGLRAYLREPLSIEAALRLHEQQLRDREHSFLRLMRDAVYGHAGSPYRALLAWARIEYADVERLVRERGVEGALAELYAAGVYVSLEEFKGRRNIARPGLERICRAEDFDNPLLAGAIHGQTSGSRGAARRLTFDFEHLVDDVPAHALLLENFGAQDDPMALWRPVPPGAAGIRRALIHAKLGKKSVRWFSQSPTHWPGAPLPSAMLTFATTLGCSLWSAGFPRAEFLPLDQAGVVAEWLAQQKSAGRRLHFATGVSSAVRICQAALEQCLDIAGTFFDLGGEAYTPSRQALIRAAGCTAGCFYSMTEVGQIGCPCGDPAVSDDSHVLRAKIAMTQFATADRPDALWFTTLRPSPPKILLNVETGDTGVLETRACGCAAGRAGLDLHVHTVRSYEKLTSEGMHFLGSDLLRLVEDILPAAFGGVPTDYQFVERHRDGISEVSIVVHPRLGPVDEARVVATVLDFLGSRSRGDRMMADVWNQGRTLRVLRREPYSTASAKIPVLHTLTEK